MTIFTFIVADSVEEMTAKKHCKYGNSCGLFEVCSFC